MANSVEDFSRRILTFGFSREDVERTIVPMAQNASEPVASMGNDTPAGCAEQASATALQLLSAAVRSGHQSGHDPIREELVMSLTE